MTTIENSAFVLMIILLIYTLGISLYNAGYEIAFRMRKTISFKSYNYLVKMYNTSINYVNITLLSSVILLSILYFGLFIGSSVVRIYLLALIPIDFTIAIFIYFECSRPKYNNITVLTFSSYYNNLRRIERAKNTLLDKINNLQIQFEDEATTLNQKLYKYNQVLPNETKVKELESCINERKEEFEKDKAELKSYNKSIITQFNESITEYVVQGIAPSFDIPEYQHIDISEIKEYINEIRNAYYAYFKEYLVEKVISGAVNKSDKLLIAFDIALSSKAKFTTDEVVAMLESIDKSVQDKSAVAQYLFNKKIIQEDVLFNQIIEKDWDWCFNPEILACLTRKQLIKTYQTILEKNAKKCCNVLLKIKTFDQTDVIDRVLNTINVENSCVQTMKFHRVVMNNVQEFDDETTMYENMALAVKDNLAKAPLNQNKAWVLDVCKNEKYYENKDEILRNYIKISDSIQHKYQKLIEVLMCYYDGYLSQCEFVDNTGLMNFYMENVMTLNDNALKYFNLLLSAVVMVYDTNISNKKIAIDSIKSENFVSQLALENFAIVEQNGRAIIKKLLKEKLDKIIPIVNRTEKVRMSLDKLLSV